MKAFQQFSRIYPLLKTLRFELKPVGNTLEHINKNGLLEQDQHRAKSYIQMKYIIDEYHKDFIEKVLDDLELLYNAEGKNDSLSEFYSTYMIKSKDENQRNLLEEIQEELRKQIANAFNKSDIYKRIFSEKLIKEDLKNFITTQKDNDKREQDIRIIEEFKNFTTYFSGFHENRKNMYSAEAQSTAIAYRLIHENLPRFIDNIMVFDKVAASPIAEVFSELYTNFEEYLNVMNIDEIFKLNYFNVVLTQKQIDVYNAIIGGKTIENTNIKIKGLNEYINLYNQQQKDKSARLPKLKPLYKQILSDCNAISWLPEQFESDDKLLEAIQKAYQELDEQVLNRKIEGEHSLRELLVGLADYDLSKIYIRNDLQLTDISQKVFGHWGVISKALLEELKNEVPKKPKKENDEAYEERLNKLIKSQGSISIAFINECVNKLLSEEQKTIQGYFAELGAVNNETIQKENLFAQIENAYTEVKDLLNTPYIGKNLAQEKVNVEKIKNLLDAIKALQHFIKPLLGDGTEPEKDEKFYGEFVALWEELDKITPLYNMVRNYMTRKPYKTEKIKLYFENNGMFLNGWVDSKTDKSDNGTQYGGYLFRKQNVLGEYDYYLGISSDIKLFRRDTFIEESDISEYERLDYYQLKSQTIYGSAYQGNYTFESAQIIDAIDSFIENYGDNNLKKNIYQDRQTKNPKTSTAKGYLNYLKNNTSVYDAILKDEVFIKANNQLIESIKKTLFTFKRIPKAQELAKNKFVLFVDLMNEIEELVKVKVYTYFPVSVREFESATTRIRKPLYLFKISNKDLSFAESYSKGLRKSRGTDNLHTLYFKALMGGNQNVFDIGTGAVYFRELSLKYTEEEFKRGHHHNQLKDKFPYPIISNKRYAYDKFQFHLSINQNYLADKISEKEMNRKVHEYIRKSDDMHIIGIDRGERHLLYLTVINLKGEIKEQYSLNEIVNTYKGNEYRTDYHDLLSKREDERMKARQSWQTIENIKNLKEGYLSQVVHKIAELMTKYNAIVVLEDLNAGFMRGRQKVESSVYQKFEKMLIDKLNYLADKKKQPEELGGILNAYQLTNKFVSFQKMGKQCGFLFYTQAWNTSKIDPVTGFVNLFDTRYETREKAKSFFGKFDSIRYNGEKDWFEFTFDYTKFTLKAEGSRTNWTLCTYGKRIETFRDEKQNSNWTSREIVLTDKFKEFFNDYGISILSNLKEAIMQQDSADFFKGLLYLLKLTLQMRNSATGTDVDYMQSPIADEDGNFYNSNTCDKSLPQNADANGAYNIARKGLWIVQQIKASDDLRNLKLAITNKEWLQFAQSKPYLD